jgi:TrpR-related protein YerC/YecD
LVEAVLALKDAAEAKAFLRDLLTESELVEFGNRWKAAQMLSDKALYTDIVKKTGLSSTTVARISKWLQNGKGGYRMMIERLHHHHNHTNPSSGRALVA